MTVTAEDRCASGVVGRECIARQMVGYVEEVSSQGLMTVALEGVQVREVAGVVPLPRVGEAVQFTVGGSVVRGVWVGLRSPLPDSGSPVTVRLLVGSEVVTAAVEVGSVDARHSVVGGIEPEARQAALAVASVASDLDREHAQHSGWVDGFVAALREAADDNDLCETFDEFMANHGFQARRYEFEVRLSAMVTVTVEAESEEDARDMIDTDRVKEAMYEGGWSVESVDQGERVN